MKHLPRCCCGENHTHQFEKGTRRLLRRTIERQGRVQPVTTPEGTWLVPRVFTAHHGLKADLIPALAAYFGWEKVGK